MNNSALLRGERNFIELFTRLIFASIYAIWAGRAFFNYWTDHDIGVLILFFSELFTFGLIIFARNPTQSNRSPYAWLLVAISLFFVVGIELSTSHTIALVSPTITMPLQLFGFGFQLIAKRRLGRSFALLPENRGVVVSGVYRIIRHPIYLGYLLNQIGFLLAFFNYWNLVVLTILYASLLLRITEEEKLLQTSAVYQQYMQKTCYRLIPFLY